MATIKKGTLVAIDMRDDIKPGKKTALGIIISIEPAGIDPTRNDCEIRCIFPPITRDRTITVSEENLCPLAQNVESHDFWEEFPQIILTLLQKIENIERRLPPPTS